MEYTISPDETVSEAVVFGVSVFENRESTTFDSLDDTVDTDALDNLFAPGFDGIPRQGGRVSFVYGQSRVIIEDNEQIEVTSIS